MMLQQQYINTQKVNAELGALCRVFKAQQTVDNMNYITGFTEDTFRLIKGHDAT